MLVSRPSTTVSASAARSRRSAASRSGPHATTFASIGSYAVPTSVPSSSPESTRTPGPDGSRSSRTRPADGRKSTRSPPSATRAVSA